MASKRPAYTWENGYQELATSSSLPSEEEHGNEAHDGTDSYVAPPSVDLVTSTAHNDFGVNVITNWPTLYDGTNSPHGIPSWWQPQDKVDVLICGAGPSGLGLAVGLARQGVSFRIIDKAEGPLVAGRADGVQPRFLETVATFGLATEIHEEGPLIDRTAMYKDGKKLIFTRSHQSDSRYRGLHVITQGQVERIYIRDLLRHKSIVERNCVLDEFSVEATGDDVERDLYPVRATIHNERTGEKQSVQAKFLVGCDGGASKIRKTINIPFDGVSTDIYWGIMDCVFETDYPHAWVFGLYTQLDISHTGPISASRQARDPTFAETGGRVEVHSITPEEVLEQANRIFAPFTLKFASAIISERVARTYSSPDMRVHLAGDAAHIHSVLGAFGLNASVLDVANLSWKLGLAAKGQGKIKELLPTYTSERRKHAVRIIRVSGEYLRFICGSSMAVPDLNNPEAMDKAHGQASQIQGADTTSQDLNGKPDGNHVAEDNEESQRAKDLAFIGKFFKANGQFLLGVDCGYDESTVVSPAGLQEYTRQRKRPPLRVRNGVRAPNPRVCMSTDETGYLYDKLVGPARFHLVLFASSLAGGEVRRQVGKFAEAINAPDGFYQRFGGARLFNAVLVVKLLPFEFEALPAPQSRLLKPLREIGATVVFDDRSPDEDAHTTWGVNHVTGAVAVIRPDLWVGQTCYPEQTDLIGEYFEAFLREV
ncbi:hypothetical protein DL767_002432 [Monosporascus sp. MG133]|nr:hypothetical protein DL767_002432 [Monosporascus sp. MG133]